MLTKMITMVRSYDNTTAADVGARTVLSARVDVAPVRAPSFVENVPEDDELSVEVVDRYA